MSGNFAQFARVKFSLSKHENNNKQTNGISAYTKQLELELNASLADALDVVLIELRFFSSLSSTKKSMLAKVCFVSQLVCLFLILILAWWCCSSKQQQSPLICRRLRARFLSLCCSFCLLFAAAAKVVVVVILLSFLLASICCLLVWWWDFLFLFAKKYFVLLWLATICCIFWWFFSSFFLVVVFFFLLFTKILPILLKIIKCCVHSIDFILCNETIPFI